MKPPGEQLAVIRDVHFGVGDRGTVCMWFSAYITEGSAAVQVLSVERAVELIAAAGVDDVRKLDGRTCWVDVTGSTITFKRYARIG